MKIEQSDGEQVTVTIARDDFGYLMIALGYAIAAARGKGDPARGPDVELAESLERVMGRIMAGEPR